MTGPNLALRQQLMQHVETVYRDAGKNPGGATMRRYLDAFRGVHDTESFAALLEQITNDAKGDQK